MSKPAEPAPTEEKKEDAKGPQVFIEQARQLKVPGEGQTVDPLIEVSCLGEKKFSSAKDDIGPAATVSWQEHIFFEPKAVKQEDIEQAKITIRCLDKGFFKDAIVGLYEFDVAYIYFMKDHLLLHKWLALSNPAAPNFDEVTGYLKISISVAAQGDQQIQINEDQGGDKSDEAILMPTSIKPDFYQLKFRFFQAQKLPIMDKDLFGKGGSIDAYIICNYLNQKLKTKVFTMKNEIVIWNQEFLIPVQLPIMSGRLIMKLYDEDKVTADELVGSMFFNLKEIVSNSKANNKDEPYLFWKNIYGSPLGCSGENTNNMNNNPEQASTWKGRILMQVNVEKTDKPNIKLQDLDEVTRMIANPFFINREYEITVEFGMGIALPVADTQYKICVQIGELEIETDKVFVLNTQNRWFTRKTVKFIAPYQSIDDMGRVYFYLMDGKKKISFAKRDIDEFTDLDAKMNWIELQPDLAIGKCKEDHKAGIISVKLCVHDLTRNGPVDYKLINAWKKDPPKRPEVFTVRAYIYQCRDLPAADSDGQSDPYVTLWDTSKIVQQTRYIEDNVNPLFYECLELNIEAPNKEQLPPFVLDVYDKDFVPLDPDDFLGRAIINIEDASYNDMDSVPKPKWHPIRVRQGAPMCGEILVSFTIVKDDFKFNVPLRYLNLMETVVFDDYSIEINILGLRDLQSVGILPVKKAFLQFNLKSLVPPQCSQAIENIKTQPGPAGPNPTINTLIKFTLPLPGDPLYCPKLQCSVFDNIFKSFMQPLLGVFTIPIGDILFKQQAKHQKNMEQLDVIIKALDDMFQDQAVMTYNIQEKFIEADEEEFRELMNNSKDQIKTALGQNEESKSTLSTVIKKKNGPDDTLFVPLMGYPDSDEEEEQQKMQMIPSKKVVVEKTPVYTPKRTQVEEKKSAVATPRLTPRDFVANSAQKAKGGLGFLKSGMNLFDKFTSVNKKDEMDKQKEKDQKVKRDAEDQRKREEEEMKRSGANPFKNTIKPTYTLDTKLNVYREYVKPPESLYLPVGYDEEPPKDDEIGKKQYRRYYQDELEDLKDMMKLPFDQYFLKRGQTRGASGGWFSFGSKKQDESGETNTEQEVGKFKCIIDVVSEKEKKEQQETKEDKIHQLKLKLDRISIKRTGKPVEFNIEKLESMEGRMKFRLQMEKLGVAHLNITKHLASITATDTLKKMLLTKTKCIVRPYILSAFNLAKRDIGSESDPYLKLSIGNKVYDDRVNYQDDEPNPDFYKSFEFETVFPGCPLLIIQIYDYDPLFGDDLIGETKVDLEDRFFSPEWQSIKEKPIEYRQLFHESSAMSQGVVKCWIDIMPTTLNEAKTVLDIRPRPEEQFEIRVAVHDTLGIKMMDAEGTSDAYIRCFFDSKKEAKETDTHFRCSDGKASFNYRLLFNQTYSTHPKHQKQVFTLQAYDRDFFKSNDIIGEAMLDLLSVIEDCALCKRPISINKSYYNGCMKERGITLEFKDDNSFWLQLISRDEKGQIEKTGKVRISIDILPKDQAEKNPVGDARSEPNVNPFLPPPIGRLSFSLNPFKMLVRLSQLIQQMQMVGPAMRRKIYCYCCLAICCSILIMCLPMILSNLVTSILMIPFS